ncbi:MAG: DUF2339 domain-containing protein [Myxococcaceae bacterium]|nr:DUF2339 domain-containing protein [Myxococcaceae bacterium]
MHSTPSLDSRVLTFAGAGLLALAAIFGWQELELQGVLIAVVGSAAAALFSLQRLEGVLRWLSPALLVVAGLASALSWLAFKLPLLLLGVALPVIGAAWIATRLRRTDSPVPSGAAKELPLRLPEFLTWQTLGLGLVMLTGGAYFHLLTLHVDDLGRRLVLTIVWTVIGLGALLLARKLEDTAPRDAGFVVLACAVAKATLYDTTHLFGGLRVAVLVAVGALLLVGARVLDRMRAAQELP